jgi:hypothetical protein
MALWLPDLAALAVDLVVRERAVVGVANRDEGLRTRLLPGRIHVPRRLARRVGHITKRVICKCLLVRAVERFDDRVNGRPRNWRESKSATESASAKNTAVRRIVPPFCWVSPDRKRPPR